MSWFIKAAHIVKLDNLIEKPFVNKCHVCNSLLSNQEFTHAIEPLIQQEREKIYTKYLKEHQN